MENQLLTTSTTQMPEITPVFTIVWLALFVLMIASQWTLFSKAGQPGWACIIPIYSSIVYLRIGGKPWYWIFLMLIPLVNIILGIIALQAFLQAYGKGSVGSVLLALFFSIFYFPYLAFSSNVKYEGV